MLQKYFGLLVNANVVNNANKWNFDVLLLTFYSVQMNMTKKRRVSATKNTPTNHNLLLAFVLNKNMLSN